MTILISAKLSFIMLNEKDIICIFWKKKGYSILLSAWYSEKQPRFSLVFSLPWGGRFEITLCIHSDRQRSRSVTFEFLIAELSVRDILKYVQIFHAKIAAGWLNDVFFSANYRDIFVFCSNIHAVLQTTLSNFRYAILFCPRIIFHLFLKYNLNMFPLFAFQCSISPT